MGKVELLNLAKNKMEGAISAFEGNLKGLRVGRAAASFVEPVQVEAYGDKQFITQVASISTPDARTISIQVWDKALVKQVEKAIVEANLGVSPVSDGQLIRLNIPPLNEERRKELVKVAAKYAEESKVAVRNVRRDIIDNLKKIQKDGIISEDELRISSEQMQKITDEFVAKIDKILAAKEKEIVSL
jgi:ribosome recycling factor